MNDYLKSALTERYLRILSEVDPAFFKQCQQGNLSDLFLASVPDGYSNAKNKIMIVGRETRCWNVKVATYPLDTYIERAIDTQSNHFVKELEAKQTKGRSFHNFTRSVKNKCGVSGLIYANLFCFAWNKGLTLKAPDFQSVIEPLSIKLLQAQIEILKPDIIIFACGEKGIATRKKVIPNPPRESHLDMDYIDKGIPNENLWKFSVEFFGKSIECYRIKHPANRGRKVKFAKDAEKYLISELLPNN